MKKLEHILHSRTELNLEAIALMGQMQASHSGCSCTALWGVPAIAVEAGVLMGTVAVPLMRLCGCLHWSVAGAPPAGPSSGAIMQWGNSRPAWGANLP